MTGAVPLREVSHLRLLLPSSEWWIHDLGWIPVSPTEIHLACRYYPLAVSVEAQRATLGLLIDKRYIAHALLDADGKWRGAYRPIALRCYPFQAPQLSGDPLSDIVIAPDSRYLSPDSGVPIVTKGGPNDWVTELHRLFHLLKRGEDSFAGVIDQFFLAGLLEPLADLDDMRPDRKAALYVVDPTRFAQLKNAALGAMARHNFLSVDVATACLFSLQNLKPEFRPNKVDPHRRASLSPADMALDPIVINDIPLALDDGELVSPSHVDAM